MGWTVDEAITRIRLQGRIPDNVPDYTDAAICMQMDAYVLSHIMPAIMAVRGGHAVTYTDITATAGDATYNVPERAAGNALVNVVWIGSDSRERGLLAITEQDALAFSPATNGSPQAFLIRGNTVRLYPAPTTTGTVRLQFTQRWPQFDVVGTAGFRIVSIDTALRTVSFTGTVPASWAAYATTPISIDFVQATSPFVYRAVDLPVTGTAQVGPTGTVEADGAAFPADLQVGDYVTTAFRSPIVNLPLELHPALHDGTAGMILSSMQDYEAASARLSIAESAITRWQEMATPRVTYATPKIINRFSALRSRRVRGYG